MAKENPQRPPEENLVIIKSARETIRKITTPDLRQDISWLSHLRIAAGELDQTIKNLRKIQ